ncbi:hypothetical protein LRS06_03710 [Hymenobacter sp. J193]|uniref:hypothetical protein n=1 Tax=Hymenobacter sp. J193 TaxID=2898429 RepID=UPI002151DA40|nr:hypothetical protein [Hymenobacter sp. J193]MCR5886894.1 hypothetical protein [Hymenobacter sp. J193]
MKKLYTLALVLFLLNGSAMAAGTGTGHSKGLQDKEFVAPAPYSYQVSNRALRVTAFFTDVLRLSHTQAMAVQKATLAKLQQLEQAGEQPEVMPLLADDETLLALPGIAHTMQQYDVAMLRILTPGQYSSFRFLEERQPAADLLALGSAQ